MLQLIPGSDTAAQTDTFAIDQKKGTWTPAPQHLRTKSFPTPYAQAEMMSHVLGQLSLDPGARQPEPESVNDRLQQTFERWRLVVMALCLSEVTLETVDLLRPECDNFGRMLFDLRPECRFFGLLRDARRPGAEGRRLLVGATDPECLLWCSPRVARSNYWAELKTRIDASAQRHEALQLLADWRAVFERNGAWAPGHEQSPTWMKALQVLLGDVQPGGNLRSDARMVGPVRLAVVPRGGNDPTEVIVYLPVREPGWASRFSELLFFQPVRRDAGTVDLVDPNGRAVVTLRMAPRDAAQGEASGRSTMSADAASVAGFELLAGVGRIEGNPNLARSHGQAHWLEDHAATPGYRSLVLNPLLAAAARSHRRATIAEGDVHAFPVLFPDTIRLALTPAGDALPGAVRIHMSREVTARLAPGVPAPQAGASLGKWSPGTALPKIVAVPGSTGAVAAGLVESFGPEGRAVDVGELRALGFSLWLYFLGDAELRSDGQRLLWTADEAKELFGKVIVHNAERPLEVLKEALSAVHGEVERQRARDRLATLQRFRNTWRAVGDGDGEQPAVQAARLGRVAAETFAEWALNGAAIGSFGFRQATAAEHFTLGEGARLPLYLDVFARSDGA
ncbi:MAG: hypothetical protein HY909_12130 [Deltaproteobacteria bacterium]|nr:hypothetical protein [Deltaproteobacteria bacterium]